MKNSSASCLRWRRRLVTSSRSRWRKTRRRRTRCDSRQITAPTCLLKRWGFVTCSPRNYRPRQRYDSAASCYWCWLRFCTSFCICVFVCICASLSLLPPFWYTASDNDCLEDKREDYQNWSVLYLCTQIVHIDMHRHTHIHCESKNWTLFHLSITLANNSFTVADRN